MIRFRDSDNGWNWQDRITKRDELKKKKKDLQKYAEGPLKASDGCQTDLYRMNLCTAWKVTASRGGSEPRTDSEVSRE